MYSPTSEIITYEQQIARAKATEAALRRQLLDAQHDAQATADILGTLLDIANEQPEGRDWFGKHARGQVERMRALLEVAT